MATWVSGFGFSPVETEDLRRLRSLVKMMVFPGTNVLRKALPPGTAPSQIPSAAPNAALADMPAETEQPAAVDNGAAETFLEADVEMQAEGKPGTGGPTTTASAVAASPGRAAGGGSGGEDDDAEDSALTGVTSDHEECRAPKRRALRSWAT